MDPKNKAGYDRAKKKKQQKTIFPKEKIQNKTNVVDPKLTAWSVKNDPST